MSDLKPCPNCESSDVKIVSDVAVCNNCYMRIFSPNFDDATDTWNSLPRRLPKEVPEGFVRVRVPVFVDSDNEPDMCRADGTAQERIVTADVPAWREPEIPTVEGVCNA